MTGRFDPQTRSRVMASVRKKNTIPEIATRKELHSRGFRYRLHRHRLRGRPDLVLPKNCAVVFVHGCFWHRHEGCRYATTPSTRVEFIQAMFEANVVRDSAIWVALLKKGWRVATIRECALRNPEQVTLAGDRLSTWLHAEANALELGEPEVSAPHAKQGCRHRQLITNLGPEKDKQG